MVIVSAAGCSPVYNRRATRERRFDYQRVPFPRNAISSVGFVSSLLFVVAMARVVPSFAAEFMGIEPRRKPT
jgi:hypothetical protein